ncbi:hypothetical protein SODALDRAFT_340699 [Sodiomyces alkalinus F11]|uniref:Arrestin-like N-terminal domain-containing protein n=1 Tax=Sodiomyces alkalinus (strain CBS 110278 / VKM F-3762 / F11) TaxID=1314773 RepID=A0A3N2PSE0_SODAK|nr:hypothetical protein SODALDRAFT_340699 [Sodiomyces alkalinus F11]ROT37400.1 hypothetical protein SODALDRAFT_340699 [Sodiomyces alkalinus F11]
MGTYLNPVSPVDRKPSPARSFLSRFALPNRNRTRHLADFHISPSEPHRQYSAGDKVYGSVIVTVVKPIRITHLTVSLHGYVRVSKGPAVADRELANPVLSGYPSTQYHGNGYASLFQDEQVLAGEGRLEAAKYQFRFELQFPGKGLPSSIDFERGTISYMITATMTRPTSINATTTCERKIALIEKIDIGLLPRPRPKMIYVEPISKKSRRRKQAAGQERPPISSDVTDQGSDRDSVTESTPIGAEVQSQDANDMQGSPIQHDVRSEVSAESGRTSGSNLSDQVPDMQVATALAANAKLQAVDDKTIIATMQLLRGGALAGDTTTVRVTVQHTKPLKSMHGLIITLYRRGEIDTAPPSSLFADVVSEHDSQRLTKEDYFPRSRTGLSGLSLSSSSRSRPHFRKDLSQVVAPLIIDPDTLETTVSATVKVPEDAFPTIKGVPGGMISFRYYVEVVMDLGGRMASYLQGSNQSRGGGGYGAGTSAMDGSNYMSRGGNIIDTEALRHRNLKGVVWGSLELVMGTVDSTRERGRSNTLMTYQLRDDSTSQDEIISPWSEDIPVESGPGHWQPSAPSTPAPSQPAPLQPAPSQPTPSQPLSPRAQLLNGQATAAPPQAVGLGVNEEAPAYVPPPRLPDEGTLTDKQRVRLQEQRLLPSRPPRSPEAEAGPSRSAAAEPEPNIYDADDEPAMVPPMTSALETAPSSAETDGVEQGPSAPTLEDIESGQGEDKLELERQRLLREASAPPQFPDDYESGPSRPSAPTARQAEDFEPSAPVLTEEDEYGAQYAYGTEARAETGGISSSANHSARSEPLPRYER